MAQKPWQSRLYGFGQDLFGHYQWQDLLFNRFHRFLVQKHRDEKRKTTPVVTDEEGHPGTAFIDG
jgi:hypothetical protein